MKLKEKRKKKPVSTKEKDRPVKKRKVAEGGRFGALGLLVVTIILSILFYLYGLWTNKGITLEFGNITNTWEFSR